jgi:hypothetical protein
MSATHDVSLESVARIYCSCLPPRPMKHGPQVSAPQAADRRSTEQGRQVAERQSREGAEYVQS